MKPYTICVMDLGGTNIRFGLLGDGDTHPSHIQCLQVADFPSLSAALRHFLGSAPATALQAVCMAVATPVSSQRIQLTNNDWHFDIADIGREFGLQRVKAVNDFTALALAIPLLGPTDLQAVGNGVANPDGPMALLGAGTGLGVSGLVRTGEGWYPIQGEGGHVTIGARNARELGIFEFFWQRYGHISAERLLSGIGLAETYQAICALDHLPPEALQPAGIVARALAESCPVCVELLNLFCGWLGVVAGNLALTLGATGGVYIGGGIVPKLGEYFIQSPFRSNFGQRGRFSAYLEQIPVYVIHADQPALLGAGRALDPCFGALGVTWEATATAVRG